MKQISIKGKLVAECLIQAQIANIRSSISAASVEIDKLQKLLKEVEHEKDFSNYDDFIRACRILR